MVESTGMLRPSNFLFFEGKFYNFWISAPW